MNPYSGLKPLDDHTFMLSNFPTVLRFPLAPSTYYIKIVRTSIPSVSGDGIPEQSSTMLSFRKNIMACSGLFLCLFLLIHLGANLLLLLPEATARSAYNSYSTTLRESPLIQVVSIFLYLSILLHVIYAAIITYHNRKAKPSKYVADNPGANSSWASRNMGLLGLIILVFIVVHLMNFWARIKLGIGDAVGVDAAGHVDVYQVTTSLFKNVYYTAFYSTLMIPLGFHLYHGVNSAFKTLGLYHKKWLGRLAKASLAYTILICVGFAVIPIVIFFR